MHYFQIEATIETTKGRYVRRSVSVAVPETESQNVEINGGLLSYPDIRCTRLRVLSADDNTVFMECRTVDGDPASFATVRSLTNNLAYAVIPNINLQDQIGGGFGYYPNPFNKTTEVADTSTDRDVNRLLVSEVSQPHALPAAQAMYVHSSEDDPIMRFEANVLQVEEGPFGVAPILVISKQSVEALEVGDGDIVFSNAYRLADRGTSSRYGSANANGLIFLVSTDGVWVLSPTLSDGPVSAPLHAFDAADDILDDLDANVVATYVDDGRGNREVRLGTANKTYVYSFEYREWYTLARSRGVQYRDGARLLAYDAQEQVITEELQTTDVGLLTPAGVPFRLQTAPYKLRYPGELKRFYRIGIRQRIELDEIDYLVLDPIDPDRRGGEVDTVISAATDATKAYLDSITITDPGELVVGNVYEETWVVGEDEGAVVAAGYLLSGVQTDQISLVASSGHDVVVHLSGKGKPGQGLESIDFDYEPRRLHRARKRNYPSTV